MITIFTTPKPFEGHIATIQSNAINSWKALDPKLEVIIFWNMDDDVEEEIDYAIELSCQLNAVPIFISNDHLGMPFARMIFDRAARIADTEIIAYVNADIMLFEDFLPAVDRVDSSYEEYMIVGRRHDFALDHQIDFSDPEQVEAAYKAARKGKLHSKAGIDYFVLRKEHWHNFPPMPDLLIAGTCYDNWLVNAGLKSGVVVNATQSIVAGHQHHAYRRDGTIEAWINYNRSTFNPATYSDIGDVHLMLGEIS